MQAGDEHDEWRPTGKVFWGLTPLGYHQTSLREEGRIRYVGRACDNSCWFRSGRIPDLSGIFANESDLCQDP